MQRAWQNRAVLPRSTSQKGAEVFVYTKQKRALRKRGFVPGIYRAVPFGVNDEYVVVLEGAGGGCWYPTKEDAETAAQRQNAELCEAGLAWVHQAGAAHAPRT